MHFSFPLTSDCPICASKVSIANRRTNLEKQDDSIFLIETRMLATRESGRPDVTSFGQNIYLHSDLDFIFVDPQRAV